MDKSNKKFISPRAWFSFEYPKEWCEFPDEQGTFLFYNPDVWNGNFRISAYRGTEGYGEQYLEKELKRDKTLRTTNIGRAKAIYSEHMTEEDGEVYVSHCYLIGLDCMVFDCSMTMKKGGDRKIVEEIIETIAVRKDNTKYHAELIELRLSEIEYINSCYEWVTETVKKKYAVAFEGTEKDIKTLQRLIDTGDISAKNREEWIAVGIAVCVILANEVEEVRWKTLIDGNREDAVLTLGDHMIDPMKIVWSKVKRNEKVDLAREYENLLG